MTVLAYQYVPSFADHILFFEGLKDFCLARGWTIDDWRTNVEWKHDGEEYTWVGGAEAFLKLHSDGYGSQQLNFKFRILALGTFPDWESFYYNGFTDANFPEDPGDSTNPAQEDIWSRGIKSSIHPNNIGPVWFFGNDKFIFVVYRVWETDRSLTIYDITDTYNFICFGSLELLDTTTDEGMMCCVAHSGTQGYEWNRTRSMIPFSFNMAKTLYLWGNPIDLIRSDMHDPDRNNLITYVNYTPLLVTRYSYNDRFLRKTFVYGSDVSIPAYKPIGKVPFYRTNVYGLEPGEMIEIDGKKFLCFPNGGRNYNAGCAIRIE